MFSRNIAKALIYNTENNRLLLVREVIPSKPWETYDLPGGGIKKRESAQSALLREINEEISLSRNDMDTIMEIPVSRNPVKKYMWILPINTTINLFWVTLSEPVDLKTNWEIPEARWVRPRDLPLLLHPVYKQLLGHKFLYMLRGE